jgi:hypothetical protein
MKSLTFLFVFLSLTYSLTAQRDSSNQSFIKRNCKQVAISLRKENWRPDPFSAFSNIEVIDARPDTSRIGLVAEHNSRKELIFHNTVSAALASHLKNYYTDPRAKQTLLVILKKLCVFDSLIVKPKRVDGFTPPTPPPTVKMRFRTEAFLKGPDGWLPLTYLDTLVSSTYGAEYIATNYLPFLLDVFMDKLSSIDLAAVIKQSRVFSDHDIESFNRSGFAYPMDTASTLKKGVYTSLEEFKNNKPSIGDYELTKDGQGNLELNIKDQQGKLYYTHTMWGFCDGEHSFVMMDGNLFPILPVNHEWYIWGTKEYVTKKFSTPLVILFPAAYFLASVPVTESVSRKMRFFQIDIDSGEIY